MGEDSSGKRGRRSRTLGPAGGSLPQLFESDELREVSSALGIPELPMANLEIVEDEEPAPDEDDARRRHRRRRFRKGLEVTINGRRFHARGVDVSRGGIACQPVPRGAKNGDPVLIELAEEPYRLLGRIVWFKPLGDGSDHLVIGVRFSRPLEASLDGEED